ncbi:MAG: carbohydrate binding family 9 domain-containing protein [Ignavibacteriae bacterium]|nr:carbohydrate binding family 9 domain-containing protein [Ignavibacteriota bacterium]MCI0707939.1 carbohydrate binding family 9 domain-containing protein [Ignavibacteriota bacterium]
MNLRTNSRSIALLLVFSLSLPSAYSQNQIVTNLSDPREQRVLTAVRCFESVSIDGKLTELLWKGSGTTGFIQREPEEGVSATEDTEIWIAYDDYALYIAARMYDSEPDSIIGRLARRDENPGADHIGIFIDAAYDRRTGYYFIINPSGAIRDGAFSNDTFLDPKWDGVWEAAVGTDEKGWTAEFRIPYSQLRFSKQDEYTWGIDFYRRVERKNEESFLVFHPRNDRLRVSRWADLNGLAGIEPPSRIEVLPYITSTGKFIERPPVHSFNIGRDDPFVIGRDYQAALGADAKIGLSGDMTLDVSLNPDFAQVEVDPAVVNLTAYEVRYDEKRPFFIEGSDILRFGGGGAVSLNNFEWSDPSFFYSRRVGRAPQGFVTHNGFENIPDRTTILGAAKVSGKIDNTWSIAALSAVTEREYGSVDSAGNQFSEEVEPLTFYAVVRTRKEFNDARQAVGIIGTIMGRDLNGEQLSNLMNSRALSGGLDGWVFLDQAKDWVVTGWAGGSYVQGSKQRMLSLQRSSQHFFQRPDADHVSVDSNATSMAGWATRVWVDKVKGNFFFNAALGMIHPKFETNDTGFLNYADYINTHIYTGYQWYDLDNFFRYKYVGGWVLRAYNFGGIATRESYSLGVGGTLLNYWGGNLAFSHNARTFDDQRTRGGPLMESQESNSISFEVYSDARERLSGSAVFSGASATTGSWLYSTGVTLEWKASSTVKLSISPSLLRVYQVAQYVDAILDPRAAETYGTRYIFGSLHQTQVAASLRLSWTFTPKLSLQVFMQPLLSTGDYTELKELARPRSFSFNQYGENSSTISLNNNVYTITPDTNSLIQNAFLLNNPNFNYKFLNLNAVLRWEFLPGSTMYLVWTNEKFDYEVNGDFRFGRDLSTLFRDRPDNVISLKLTYWWSR